MDKKLTNIAKVLILVYFSNLFLYSFFSMLGNQEIVTVFWFIRIPILAVLYFATSFKRNMLYLFALLFYQLASVFFFLGGDHYFWYATICSVTFKFCLVLLVVRLISSKNRLAIGFASVPFFVLYLYVIELIINSLAETYFIWIINALLTSFIGGVAIINYVNHSEKKYYWLLISSILFIVQIAAFFINKFYVKNDMVYQFVILSYGISHFTFYLFMNLKEQE